VSEFFHGSWWVIAFFVIGLLSAFTTVVSLFFGIGRRPSHTSARVVPPVGSEEFLVGIAATVNAPVVVGGTVELLNNGDTFFPAMFEAMAAARDHIHFAAYIWEPGKVSDEMFRILTEKARAGVEVRVLLDGLGGIRTPRKGVRELRAAGGQVERFRPARIGKLSRFYKRMHRRAIVIDGVVGFTGGAAVGDKWLGEARVATEWRDSMVRVTGPLAGALQSGFTEPWAYVSGEILVGSRYHSTLSIEGTTAPGALRAVSLVSSPSSEEYPLRLFFILSFLAARERLYITTPYFVPDQNIREAVMARARAGVDVRLLLPNELTDAKPVRLATHSYFAELLRAGVRIFEYQPARLHAKTAVVDGRWSVVGSANLDIRSSELNQENVLGILDAGFAARLEKTFLEDLDHSQEIRIEGWRRRGLGQRVLERAARIFQEQY
jgi:cardiolipin synthase